MKNLHHITVALNFTEGEANLQKFKKMDFLKKANLRLLHLSQINDYHFIDEVDVTLYPAKEAKLILEQKVYEKLNRFREELIRENFLGEISCECRFTKSPKKEMCQDSDKRRVDLAVMFASDKYFGSFIQYQLEHSTSFALVVKS